MVIVGAVFIIGPAKIPESLTPESLSMNYRFQHYMEVYGLVEPNFGDGCPVGNHRLSGFGKEILLDHSSSGFVHDHRNFQLPDVCSGRIWIAVCRFCIFRTVVCVRSRGFVFSEDKQKKTLFLKRLR